jgi:hypothetical protein
MYGNILEQQNEIYVMRIDGVSTSNCKFVYTYIDDYYKLLDE